MCHRPTQTNILMMNCSKWNPFRRRPFSEHARDEFVLLLLSLSQSIEELRRTATSITMAFFSNLNTDRHKTYSLINDEEYEKICPRKCRGMRQFKPKWRSKLTRIKWIQQFGRECVRWSERHVTVCSTAHRSNTHFKHSFLLNNASNSIVFILWCVVTSPFPCHLISTISLPSLSPHCSWLRHLIIFLIMCAGLTLAASISRLSSLIDRAIIFLFVVVFFFSLSLSRRVFQYILISLTCSVRFV